MSEKVNFRIFINLKPVYMDSVTFNILILTPFKNYAKHIHTRTCLY